MKYDHHSDSASGRDLGGAELTETNCEIQSFKANEFGIKPDVQVNLNHKPNI